MKRPNLSFSDATDLALTLAANSAKTTKSKVAERALREYLLVNNKEACEMANLLPKLEIVESFFDSQAVGCLEGKPVFIDKDGYLFRVKEGQQLRLNNHGGTWGVAVEGSKWKISHISTFPYGELEDNSDDIMSSGPGYEPGEYEV
jgi:hypothetical protein